MRTLLSICLVSLTCCAHAVEPKPIDQVNANELTAELQGMVADADSIDFVWWIPVEFWEATFRQGPDIPSDQVDQILGVLKSHSVLAVVQADISPFGVFKFLEKEAVMANLTVQAVDADGGLTAISHTEPSDPDLRMMLDQMRPILAQAMGNMGENFYFFPLPAFDADGERFPSPYESGLLRVTLKRSGGDSTIELAMPVDSLFIPRICPNGQPAHVSWAYCPWSGKELPR